MTEQQAQERGPSAVAADEQRRQGFEPASSAGLFVGVSKFEDRRFQEVPFAVDDAVDLAHLFSEELGLLRVERVVLALAGEPRKEETGQRLQRLKAAGARVVGAKQTDIYRWLPEVGYKGGHDGLVVVSVATHGFSDQGGDYLIAADSLLERAERTAVAVDELFDEVARTDCPRRMVLLDACRERITQGTRGSATPAMAESFAAAIASAVGQIVLAGATLGGFAYDDLERGNGVFTAAVLDGLRGAAVQDPRGFITARTLGDFVQQQVVEWVRRNRPDHAEISLGIARRIEGAAEALPLAVNPEHGRALERYRARRQAAIERMRDNYGVILTLAFMDEVETLLPIEGPGDDSEELLGEIESLDGSPRSQRSLRDYVREVTGTGASIAPVEVSLSRASLLTDRSAVVERQPQTEQTVTSPSVERAAPSGTMTSRSRSSVQRSGFARRKSSSLLVLVAKLAVILAVVLGLLYLAMLGIENINGVLNGTSSTIGAVEAIPGDSVPAPGTALDGPLGMRFRFVPHGTYWIGSPEEEPGRDDNETQHQVKLTRGFWLAETEVTQAQWSALAENPSSFKACGEDCPVENVNWFQAVAYANLLSDREDLSRCYAPTGCEGTLDSEDYTCKDVTFVGLDCPGYRLPTEAEWEVAARAGTETALYTGDLTLRGTYDGPVLDPIAWYGGNSGARTHLVGQKRANTWGLYDMLGNVWEWTWDRHDRYLGGMEKDPTGPDLGADRVIRGGSWYSDARIVRAAYRNRERPGSRDDYLGFRLARGQGPPEEAGRSPE